jgi:hypothetical protein
MLASASFVLSPAYVPRSKRRGVATAKQRHVPALQSVHELSGRIEAFPHERRLLAHGDQGILEQSSLILQGGRRGHCRCVAAGGGVAWGRCLRLESSLQLGIDEQQSVAIAPVGNGESSDRL